MKFPSPEFDEAVDALCHDTISDADAMALHELLRAHSAAQDEYLWRVELHGELAFNKLRLTSAQSDEQVLEFESSPSKPTARKLPMSALAAMLVLLLAGIWQSAWRSLEKPEVVAHMVALRDVQWTDPDAPWQTGDPVSEDQRIELQSGEVQLAFNSGARMWLVGPAIVDLLAPNGARLVLGEVSLVAETPASKGFTLITPTSTFVDIGTAFTASVAPDGLSRLEVTEGEVDVVLDEQANTPRLKAGETLYVEPGEQKIITRIEEGNGTAAFRFPSIAPPDASDYADASSGQAAIRVIAGELRNRPGPSGSGSASVLLDGVGQTRQDAPRESAFFEQNTGGSYLIDLGAEISIGKINAYSWHQHSRELEHRHRARQRYTLYGLAGDSLPDAPEQADWTRIARVNSDRYFRVTEALDRPAQQASSITASRGEIGRYRYLLWVVKSGTFFGEFDVYEQGREDER